MIPIFFSVDDNYVGPLTVALHSLAQHADPKREYQVYILTEHLTQPHRALLLAQATSNVHVDFASIGAQFKARIDDHGNTLRADYFTLTIYFRLFIAELFPDLDRALYLDADTVVLADVAELFNTPLDGALVGAVSDPFMAANPETSNYAAQAIGLPVADYVNSGVLVMDLAAMREARFANAFLTLLNRYHFRSLAPDQDYLNAMTKNRLLHLDPAWNVQGEQPQIAQPRLIHYNLFDKPWHYQGVPHEAEFWAAADDTAAAADLHAAQAAFGPAQVAADCQHKANLIQLAQSICEQPVTFAKVAASEGGVQL
ncbi:glycosyltransferase family 8 protein [Lacticaseibacillus kribbianus]|uniref:glycosyltransferase family 8 protein n=1 Tax=Lacticaseibacillus kribbianus TaxID=2926292 RepID=UPI001CD261C1|nr:glycosyltransferase family 8 protein [Lacticaseibacillus kribbianus]